MLTSAVTYLRMVFVLLGAGVALAFMILDFTVVVLITRATRSRWPSRSCSPP